MGWNKQPYKIELAYLRVYLTNKNLSYNLDSIGSMQTTLGFSSFRNYFDENNGNKNHIE